MKKKDWILILVLLAFASIALFVGYSMRHPEQQQQAELSAPQEPVSETPVVESQKEAIQASEDTSSKADNYSENVRNQTEAFFAENQADSYLLIRTDQACSVPIPLNEDYSITVRQSDGSENVIHVGINSFYMESSNCDNQNCVEEGVVTLENMNERILFNLIICLPHRLSLEMLTPAEAETALLDMLAQEEAYQAAVGMAAADDLLSDSTESGAAEG